MEGSLQPSGRPREDPTPQNRKLQGQASERGFGLRSRGITPTSLATRYPLGLRFLHTWMLEICGAELAESALGSFLELTTF